MSADAPTKSLPAGADAELARIGHDMTRMRLMTGRRLIGRRAIRNVAPGLELSHLDVLDVVRRAELTGPATVGAVADGLRIDPSRASRIVADMVNRGVLRREASQADARRIVIALTPLGERLLREIQAQKLEAVSRIVRDWPARDVEAFASLFSRFMDGYEASFAAQSFAARDPARSE